MSQRNVSARRLSVSEKGKKELKARKQAGASAEPAPVEKASTKSMVIFGVVVFAILMALFAMSGGFN